MAQRLALIPEELVGVHRLQKPELRIENDLFNLMERETLPDDMKVKLLGQLMMRYQKMVHTPPEPVWVSIADEKSSNQNSMTQSSPEDSLLVDDDILKDIFASSPRQYWKFIPMIVQKLKTRAYSWNDSGEMIANNRVIKDSRIADFFSYMFRNAKTQKEPQHFEVFLQALKEINIPHYWVGNKKLLQNISTTPIKLSKSPPPLFQSTPHNYDDTFKIAPISKRLNLSIPKWTPL